MSAPEKTPTLVTHYLHEAVKKEQDDLVASLLRRSGGVDVNARDGYGMTALMWAAGRGYQKTVQRLLSHGADVEARNERLSVRSIEKLETGKDDYWELIDRMGTLAANKHHGWTALIWAARNGQADIVNLLLDSGADVNIITKDGFTALVYAVENQQVQTAHLLLERGADPNLVEDNCSPALPIAAKHGFLDLVQTILEHGGNVKALDHLAHDALLNAVVNDQAEVLKYLLTLNVDANDICPGVVEWPPLHFAAAQDALECARVLLNHGADINAKVNEVTALQVAVDEMAGPRVANLLIEKGADVKVALTIAEHYSYLEGAMDVIKRLRSAQS